MAQSALYSEMHASKANLSLSDLEIPSWDPSDVKALQAKIKAKPVDGWFGPKSIQAWKTWRKTLTKKPPEGSDLKGVVVINGQGHQPPKGVTVVSHLQPEGIPADPNDTSPRKHTCTQFVLHRGWAGSYRKGINFAEKTEATLDARGLSTTFTMDIDGVIYQHFDPAVRRGRHATHHNVQSDSLDVGGPFSQSKTPAPGQKKITLKMAIGRHEDGKPPLARKKGTVRCLTMTPEQIVALSAFLPWYCDLRGIPVTACEDWRCFRVGGLGRRDPVTKVKGILSHTQISEPGRRVDGILPLHHLKESGAAIQWRSGEDFFDT